MSVPSEQTTAASMPLVLTLRVPSIVAARMDFVEMASTVLVTINFASSAAIGDRHSLRILLSDPICCFLY